MNHIDRACHRLWAGGEGHLAIGDLADEFVDGVANHCAKTSLTAWESDLNVSRVMCVLDAQTITSDLALCRFPGVKGMASLPIQRVQREYAEERAMTIWARGRFGSTMLAL